MNMRDMASIVWSQCIDAKKDENALIKEGRFLF